MQENMLTHAAGEARRARCSEPPEVSRGRTRFHLALTFPAAAVLCQFLEHFGPGILDGRWHGDAASYFVIPFVLSGLAFMTGLLMLWFWGFPIILLASQLLHILFGGNTPQQRWQRTTCASLWPLPYASAMGSAAYMAHSLFFPGGWPEDVIFGTIGNALGAWCYTTIFWSWWRLRSASKSEGHPLLLDEADSSGKVLIRHRDGRTFAVMPERSTRSPLDVPGVDTGITTQEIVDCLREGRERVRPPFDGEKT